MNMLKTTLILTAMMAILASCNQNRESPQQSQVASSEMTEKKAVAAPEFHVDFEEFTLDNGLRVVFHLDKSDPVVAVVLTSHVGSARELPGRTGFAHLFEHLLFLESENLGKGGLDKMSARIGGSGANGSTSRDRTNYFQTVPNDALEKMIWAEADKLGFFINTVTEDVLAKEKQVVKNEKRQSVDNRPYGHEQYVNDKNLYPEGHPYSWQVIGSLEDLQSATLQDVKDFFNKWYVPNNVYLTIAGDFDPVQAKVWVKKYFDEIKRGEDIPKREKMPVSLSATKKVYFEDNFARSPKLTLTWPTVPQYHSDAYPLAVLTELLSTGKRAPFNEILIDEKKMTSDVSMGHYNSELAGQMIVSVRAFEGTSLNDVRSAIDEAFARFEKNGIADKDLTRIKAGQETAFYNRMGSVLGKAFQLAQYQIFAGTPSYINQDIKNILAVTKDDVMRVYHHYVKDKHHVATSFVPKGQKTLALSDSRLADVKEEKIITGAEEAIDASAQAQYERTPSAIDRSVEPAYGNPPQLKVPDVWEASLNNGMRIYGIENDENPLVDFALEIKGGMLLDSLDKVGVANLLSTLLMRGTAQKTTAELQEAIQQLGAQINVNATQQYITISGKTLAKNYAATMSLVEEILLEPRFDAEEFELAKLGVISRLKQLQANPPTIAENQYRKLIYGESHILSRNPLGDLATMNEIGLEDLKAYYQSNFSPSVAKFLVVGHVNKDKVLSSLQGIDAKWANQPVGFKDYALPEVSETAQLYFYDVPGAKQSQLRIGYLALARTDDDYYPATLMNYRLGGGSFVSQLTQQLREGKGYTYGIRSVFNGSALPGPFTIQSGVRTNVTFESVALIKEIIDNYGANYNEQDLAVTKNFMLKSTARALETLDAKLNLLRQIARYDRPYDYALKQNAMVEALTVDKVKALASQYLNANKMTYLIVGDAKTQLPRLEKLNLGEIKLLNP